MLIRNNLDTTIYMKGAITEHARDDRLHKLRLTDPPVAV